MNETRQDSPSRESSSPSPQPSPRGGEGADTAALLPGQGPVYGIEEAWAKGDGVENPKAMLAPMEDWIDRLVGIFGEAEAAQ